MKQELEGELKNKLSKYKEEFDSIQKQKKAHEKEGAPGPDQSNGMWMRRDFISRYVEEHGYVLEYEMMTLLRDNGICLTHPTIKKDYKSLGIGKQMQSKPAPGEEDTFELALKLARVIKEHYRDKNQR